MRASTRRGASDDPRPIDQILATKRAKGITGKVIAAEIGGGSAVYRFYELVPAA